MSETKTDLKVPGLIAVCCGTPLVCTMMFSGAEWYCIKCQTFLPLFDAERIDWTPGLAQEQEENKDWFYEVTADYMPLTAYRSGCENCDPSTGEHHIDHATDEEKEKSKAAYTKLNEGRKRDEDC